MDIPGKRDFILISQHSFEKYGEEFAELLLENGYIEASEIYDIHGMLCRAFYWGEEKNIHWLGKEKEKENENPLDLRYELDYIKALLHHILDILD